MAIQFQLPAIIRRSSDGTTAPAFQFSLPALGAAANPRATVLNAITAAVSYRIPPREVRAVAKAAKEDPGLPDEKFAENPELRTKAQAVVNKVIEAQVNGTDEKLDEEALPIARAAGANPAMVAVALAAIDEDPRSIEGLAWLVARDRNSLLAQTALAATRAQVPAITYSQTAASGAELRRLTAKVDALAGGLDQRLSAIQGEFKGLMTAKVDALAGGLEQGLSAIQTKVDALAGGLDQRLSAIQGELNGLMTGKASPLTDGLEKRLSAIQDEFRDLMLRSAKK